jgi:mRNA-degrading endonuclease RelE of RelBE toxin-antitoxin system
MKWGLVIASRAKRQFRRVPSDDRRAIEAAFSQMCADPFEGDVKALHGLNSLRRRVGDWRILFELIESKKLIIVTAIKRRGSSTY